MIIKTIRTFFLGLLIYSLALGPSFADTAALLPPAVSQFFDNNGNPLTSGTVDTYKAGTSTRAPTWKDSAEVNPNTNPIKLDAGGKAIIYGNQVYRTVVKDRNGNLIWDAVTAPGGGGGTATLVGDGNLVGTILPWSGLLAPNQYVFAYGQEIARATFPTFYTAITQQLNVICSAASNTLTGISDTTQIRVGEPIELALCVPAGTTVISKTAATILLSNPSNVSINAVATLFPWGNGNGSTTFNVPDYRGVVLAGRPNMGGTASTNLTSSGCPGIRPDSLGATCGNQTANIAQINLPVVTLTTIIAAGQGSHIHGETATDAGGVSGVLKASTDNGVGLPVSQFTAAATLPAMTGTTSLGGSATPLSIIQPIATVNYIVKITPDTSTSIATGVFSIGGMSGVIACGGGLLCTGNIISVSGNVGGNSNDVQFNYVNTSAGIDNFQFISPDNLTLGAAGVTGKFDIFGSSTGKVRQVAQAAAGTPTITWGTSSGTPAVTTSAPLSLNTTTGNISLITGSIISGGIPYFSSTTVMASSALLTANQIMIGGGAGNPPVTFACATTTTVIHGGTPPTCGQIVNADITTNTISNNVLSQVGAATFKGNPTGSTANVQDFTIQGLTARGAPDAANDKIPLYDNAAGTIKYVTPAQVASSATAGVSSIAGNTGAFTLSGLLTNSTNVLQVVAASKSDEQTGSSAILATTPSQQQQHDSAVKAHASISATCSASPCTLGESYNVSSITRTSAGVYVVNFTTSFASASGYGCNVTANVFGGITGTKATGNIGVTTAVVSGGVFVVTDSQFDIVCYGRQ